MTKSKSKIEQKAITKVKKTKHCSWDEDIIMIAKNKHSSLYYNLFKP